MQTNEFPVIILENTRQRRSSPLAGVRFYQKKMRPALRVTGIMLGSKCTSCKTESMQLFPGRQ